MPHIIAETTGEVIELSSETSLMADEYTALWERREQLAHRVAELRQAAIDAAPAVAQAAADLAMVELRLQAAAEVIAELLPPERRTEGEASVRWRTLLGKRLEVLWPAPKRLWKKDLKDEQIAARYPDIAKTIGLRQVIGSPEAPKLTVKPATVPLPED